MIKCEICGFEMQTRINGSHLFRKHNITIKEYIEKYPNVEIGSYPNNIFKCEICGLEMSGNSAVKNKHIKTHGFKNVHEYNLHILEPNKCLCGCGELTEYSKANSKYNEYKKGHRKAWNSGLGMEDDRIKKSIEKTWNTRSNWTAEEWDNFSRKCSKNNKEIWKQGGIELREKMKTSYKNKMQEKYGVDNYFQTDEFQVKSKKTCLEKYGVENAHQSKDVLEKCKQTCLNKYGVDNTSKIPEVISKIRKNSFSTKNYILPSGKVIHLQGYENKVMDELLKTYSEDDIVYDTNQIPVIDYTTDKIRKYFPDFYIPKDNLIIEVKSTWTYDKKGKCEKTRKQNEAKFQAVRDAGYNFKLIIY